MFCAWEFIVVELKAMCVSCIVSKSLYRDRDSEYFLHFFFVALIKFFLYTMIKTLANNFDVPIFFVVYTFSLGKKKKSHLRIPVWNTIWQMSGYRAIDCDSLISLISYKEQRMTKMSSRRRCLDPIPESHVVI